ncbi:hypothetical protein JCM3766R1_000993 [Sporobolomyces carnicolor]
MPRVKRAAASKKTNYASDDEFEMEVEGQPDSGRSSSTAAVRDAEDAREYSEDDQEGEVFAPKRKKPRTSNAKAKRKPSVRVRKGKLQSMVELPLDVWYMIAEYLDPPSLLYLGRANKAMRSVFASKRSQGLWNIAKRSVHLPELESTDLNDLALASLLYDRDCHICGKKARAVLVDYSLRKRWCKKCRSASLILGSRLHTLIPAISLYTPECTLRTSQGLMRNNMDTGWHFRGDAIEINKEVRNFHRAVTHAKTKQEKEEANEALTAYVAERRVAVAAALSDAEKLDEWTRAKFYERRDATQGVRDARQAAIDAKLAELGYGGYETTDYLPGISTLVNQPFPLTEAVWERISPKIIQVAEKMKQERLRREARKRILARRELVRPHYEALREASDDDQLYPDFHLFASMPAVKEFWQEEDLTFDDGSWRSSLDRIKDEAAKATRWIKLEAARGLIAACDQVSAPVPDNVRLSIHPPRREGTPDSELSVTRDEGLVDSKLEVMPPETLLDIDDPSTISAAELDAFLSRFTARFVRRIGCTDPPVPLNDFYPQASGLFSYNDRKSIVWSAWLENQIDILEQTGLADDDEADAKLSELGPNFSSTTQWRTIHGADLTTLITPSESSTPVANLAASRNVHFAAPAIPRQAGPSTVKAR